MVMPSWRLLDKRKMTMTTQSCHSSKIWGSLETHDVHEWSMTWIGCLINVNKPSYCNCKGQLISEWNFGVLSFPKKNWQISAQESKMWSNQQNIGPFLYYYSLHIIIWTSKFHSEINWPLVSFYTVNVYR